MLFGESNNLPRRDYPKIQHCHEISGLAPERLEALRRAATVESVASSTRIEGAKLSDRDVEKLLQNLERQQFTTRDEQEVAGYADTMQLIYESHGSISLTENHIQQLHATLLKYSNKEERHRGAYKNLSNNVAAFDQDGNEIGIIFETSIPFDTPQHMQQLIEWTNQEFNHKTLHPLLIIAIFVVRFLAIHPFQDGNGRLSRILTTLLLLRNGYSYVPYSSMESIIESNKEGYYLALRRTQGTLKKTEIEWEHWLIDILPESPEKTERQPTEKSRTRALFFTNHATVIRRHPGTSQRNRQSHHQRNHHGNQCQPGNGQKSPARPGA